MLPLSDDNRGRRTLPVVTWALIAINVAIYAYQSILSRTDHWDFLQQWATVPEEIMSGTALYTLLTCAFLHGSWFHLGSNMLFLWIFGDNVEDVFGHIKYLLFYIVCAVAASMAQVLISQVSEVPLVGASGAVSGLLAAYIVMFPHGRIRTLLTLGIFVTLTMLPAWIMIGYWFVLQLISGVLSLNQVGNEGGGVAFFAHIGGFIAGLVLVIPLRDRARMMNQRYARNERTQSRRFGYGNDRW
jgi:membrane associated rhomboid family serine protease